MKKIFLVLFLLFSISLYAFPQDRFLIKITNTLETDCKLKDDIILFGHVSDYTHIPAVIHPHTTEAFMMRSGPRYAGVHNAEKTVLLTYICDSEQKITLFTNGNHYHRVDAKTFDVKNMSASFEGSNPILDRSEIHWTLSY
ncbi:MAG TPA: hypothetical protein VHD33_07250 [Legionellaceae bacterium]|nr:hypothetical protein [Legionellaceae bacterium]